MVSFGYFVVKLMRNIRNVAFGYGSEFCVNQMPYILNLEVMFFSTDYLACALGQSACLKGYSVRYYRLSRLLLTLSQTKANGTYQRLLKALAATNLLIIDDWGLEPLTAANRSDLMEIMDDRNARNKLNHHDKPVTD